MSNGPLIQFIGFVVQAETRVYTFNVKETLGEGREYTLAIQNKAFVSHRVRYQDGPGVCSFTLKRELAACSTQALKKRYAITQADLDAYDNAQPANAIRKRRRL